MRSNDPNKAQVDWTKLKTREEVEYVKQYPFVGEDGIYIPCNDYAPKGCGSTYKCVLTKELFVEAYNKWIKDGH